MTGRRVVLATRNPHKLVELRRILAAAGLGEIDLVSVAEYPDAPEVAETGETFEANALLKARAIAGVTGEIAVADDSGLAVDALCGMPGIFSARWSGGLEPGAERDETNLRLVLGQVADVPDKRRGAAFVCAAVAVFPAGRELIARGTVEGALTRVPRGANGFGYDPIFVPAGYDRTTAEMSAEEKDAISHRGRAFRALASMLSQSLQADAGSAQVTDEEQGEPATRVDEAPAGQEPPFAALQLDRARLPVCDLAEFNANDVRRVSSFSTNFGSWQAPPEVARALGMAGAGRVELEWIHDTGELVLLGGVPRVDDVEVDVPRRAAVEGAVMPAFLGGTAAAAGLDQAGNVRELFKSEVMPPGTRVAVLAHIKHGPKAHEILWGWHREHRHAQGWRWLLDRLAKLEQEPPSSDDHLG